MKKLSVKYRKLLRKFYQSLGVAALFILTGCMYGPEPNMYGPLPAPEYGVPPVEARELDAKE